MFNVTRRVSFAVAISLTVGWGIFFLLFLASSNTLLEAQQLQGEQMTPLPSGVKLSIQVDKRVYRGGDSVLIAVRNDSRMPIWIQSPGADCPSAWWTLEVLNADGETWTSVQTQKSGCSGASVVRFPDHSLKSDEWHALVPGPQLGEVFVDAPAGTYHIVMPYAKGKSVDTTTWPPSDTGRSTSAPFTIL